MAITVNTNIYSLTAQRNINRVNNKMQTAIERLSSGLRINKASDDAAGLTMAMSMEGQARGSAVAQRTIADGQSFLQIGDNTLRNANDMLQRMRELSVQYQSGLYNSSQQSAMTTEFNALKDEITASQTRAKFNGSSVFGGGGDVAVGANGETLNVTANSVDVSSLDITSATAISDVDTQITAVGSELANIGSLESRLNQASSVASSIEQAQWSSYGRVMDADMARETANLTSSQVIQQAAASALAQANSIPQIALGLLR